MAKAPAVMMYASVVSRETMHIALTIVALNDLGVKASNRNMSKSKGWTLQSSLLTFWMEKN